MSLTKQDKDDIRGIVTEVVIGVVDPRFERLEKRLLDKMASYHTVNIRHHLETRKMIGDLKQSHDKLREGLRAASA